ncbi:hypothetical protein WMY93_032814, partial [Mugilogobius chulae]
CERAESRSVPLRTTSGPVDSLGFPSVCFIRAQTAAPAARPARSSCCRGEPARSCRGEPTVERRTLAQVSSGAEGEGARGRAREEYYLEFFIPPKRPCCSIVDVRSTTALEMPDKENTFLLQLDSSAQYMIETRDAVQMRAWLSDIRNAVCLSEQDESEGTGPLDISGTPEIIDRLSQGVWRTNLRSRDLPYPGHG